MATPTQEPGSDPAVSPAIYLVPAGTEPEAAAVPAPASPGDGQPPGDPPRLELVAPDPDPEGLPVRRPIVPVPIQPGNLRGTIRYQAALRSYQTAFHLLRIPYYVLLYLWYSARGVLRLTGRLFRWWHWPEGWMLESVAVAAGRPGHREAIQAHTEGKKTRAARGRIIVLLATVAAAVIATATLLLPAWVWPMVGVVAVFVLAEHGKPRGVPVIRRAVVPAALQPPTAETITSALASIGITAITKAVDSGEGLRFLTDPHRDGDGWRTDIDLPPGVTAGMIIQRREQLSAALRRPLSAVWPEGVREEHEGRLVLWIGYQDLSKTRPKPWPLTKTGTTDVLGALPFGHDPRGRLVSVPMFELNWLIGASPGQGKTNAVRVLALGAALDPLCDLWIHEHAGKGDLEPLAQVSDRYVSGLDDESVEYTLDSVRLLYDELQRRSRIWKTLTREQKPDGKLTRELAEQYDMPPIVCVIDECQVAFGHPEYGPEIAELLGHVVRLGRAYGLIVVLSTQRPDKTAIPTNISGNILMRFCLKVPGHVENDMILGTSAHANGYRATVFRARTDAGLGWLKGESDPAVVRTDYLDLPAAHRIAARARVLRAAAGRITGYAAGHHDEEARNFLADVLTVFGSDDKLWASTIAGRLADRIPEAYADVTPVAVSSQLRNLGVEIKNVREPGEQPQRGCERSAVRAAAAGQ